MADIIRSLAHRTLRRLSTYHNLTGNADQPLEWLGQVPLCSGEALVGVYENSQTCAEEYVVVTDSGLHVYRDGRWQSVRYADIASVAAPPVAQRNKRQAEELIVTRCDGRQMSILIRGGDERYRDLWEFLRFVARVVDVTKTA